MRHTEQEDTFGYHYFYLWGEKGGISLFSERYLNQFMKNF